jgi:hypothetical protein
MYATCLFCQKDLGRNETFETFPVGRRLAFDGARGRLWVVCRHCERWNLSPLEERWEAIEEAERLYRDTRRRVATDNIGLAKMPDGTTIVRIGEPLRPEFAAWRYGDQFGRRRVRQLAIVGVGLGALGAVIAGGAVVGVGVGSFAWMIGNAGKHIVRGNPNRVVAKIKSPDGQVMEVRRRHLMETSIEPGSSSPIAVTLRYKNGQARFEGEQAMHVASRIVPAANRFGGSKKTVAEAVTHIENAGSSERFLERIGSVSRVLTRAGLTDAGDWTLSRRGRRVSRFVKRSSGQNWNTGIFALGSVQRLALEMALHEEAERAALQGELAALEAAWREAEEIAGISDSLLVPADVDEKLTKLKGE